MIKTINAIARLVTGWVREIAGIWPIAHDRLTISCPLNKSNYVTKAASIRCCFQSPAFFSSNLSASTIACCIPIDRPIPFRVPITHFRTGSVAMSTAPAT